MTKTSSSISPPSGRPLGYRGLGRYLRELARGSVGSAGRPGRLASLGLDPLGVGRLDQVVEDSPLRCPAPKRLSLGREITTAGRIRGVCRSECAADHRSRCASHG